MMFVVPGFLLVYAWLLRRVRPGTAGAFVVLAALAAILVVHHGLWLPVAGALAGAPVIGLLPRFSTSDRVGQAAGVLSGVVLAGHGVGTWWIVQNAFFVSQRGPIPLIDLPAWAVAALVLWNVVGLVVLARQPWLARA